MNTDLESLRRDCRRQIEQISEALAERYRVKAENVYRPEMHIKLQREYQSEFTALTAPIVKILTSLPPPPIVLTSEDLATGFAAHILRPDGTVERINPDQFWRQPDTEQDPSNKTT